MTSAQSERVKLVDTVEGPGRTTATLVASLAARLATLHAVSGADAVGSLTAGFAALGREVSRSAEGARMRKAIQAGRGGPNGEALWTALRISDWASGMPPSPVLQHLRNDLALLLSDDLEQTLQFLPIPSQMAGAETAPEAAPVTFLDCVMGLWAFSTELVRSVEALAGPTLAHVEVVKPSEGSQAEPQSALLR
ncbi:MAG TPA: hypothetical protein VI455_14275 [Terriglobia bacterium]